MNSRRIVLGCAALLMLTGPASADHHEKPKGKAKEGDPQAMMEAYAKAGEPVEQHRQLAKMAGKWNLAMKSWMDPKQPPMESTGTAETKAILGDRFVQTTVTSTMAGQPFSGVALTGYDKAKKKFVGTWVDSMTTGIMRSEGTMDAAGKTLTMQMTGTDPLTGKESRMRIVTRWDGDDKMTDEFYERKGGKEMKTMEIVYTRAK